MTGRWIKVFVPHADRQGVLAIERASLLSAGIGSRVRIVRAWTVKDDGVCLELEVDTGYLELFLEIPHFENVPAELWRAVLDEAMAALEREESIRTIAALPLAGEPEPADTLEHDVVWDVMTAGNILGLLRDAPSFARSTVMSRVGEGMGDSIALRVRVSPEIHADIIELIARPHGQTHACPVLQILEETAMAECWEDRPHAHRRPKRLAVPADDDDSDIPF